MEGMRLMAVFILVLVVFVFLISLTGGTIGDIQTADTPSVGQTIRFPTGYRLVAAYAYAYQVSGPFVVYICETPNGDYVTCQPSESGKP